MSERTVLVINSGSSSLKCQLYAMPTAVSLAKAVVERVGSDNAKLTFRRPGADPVSETFACRDHLTAVQHVLHLMQANGPNALPAVDIVGHRVVNAGEAFTGSVPAEPEVLAALEACSDLAPLHNPPNLAGIRACQAALPALPQVCVFDNTLHHTLPPEVYLYGLPRSFHEQHRVRRYGFHGVAFRAMLSQVVHHTGRAAEELRVVQLMLGSGCTANAMDRGRSIAVSTGLTPLEGLVQSTRCGDLDPGVVLHLLRCGKTPAELNALFNRQSGMFGLSGVSADMRDIKSAGTDQAAQSIDVFIHRLVKYVGGYTADLGGLDVLAFGGGIGENEAFIRERVCRPLAHLGIHLDPERNQVCVRGVSGIVSTPDSPVTVVVTEVDEEKVIAQDAYDVVVGAN